MSKSSGHGLGTLVVLLVISCACPATSGREAELGKGRGSTRDSMAGVRYHHMLRPFVDMSAAGAGEVGAGSEHARWRNQWSSQHVRMEYRTAAFEHLAAMHNNSRRGELKGEGDPEWEGEEKELCSVGFHAVYTCPDAHAVAAGAYLCGVRRGAQPCAGYLYVTDPPVYGSVMRTAAAIRAVTRCAVHVFLGGRGKAIAGGSAPPADGVVLHGTADPGSIADSMAALGHTALAFIIAAVSAEDVTIVTQGLGAVWDRVDQLALIVQHRRRAGTGAKPGAKVSGVGRTYSARMGPGSGPCNASRAREMLTRLERINFASFHADQDAQDPAIVHYSFLNLLSPTLIGVHPPSGPPTRDREVAASHDPAPRYLLFDSTGGRFGHYLTSMVRAVVIARAVNRTLVLMPYYDPSSKSDHLMSTVLELAALGHVVDYSQQVIEATRGTAEVVYAGLPDIHLARLRKLLTEYHMSAGRAIACPPTDKLSTSAGAVITTILRSAPNARAVAISSPLNIHTHDTWKDTWTTRCALRFSEAIRADGEHAGLARLRAAGPFLAVHIRRADFLRYCMESRLERDTCFPDTDRIVQQARSILYQLRFRGIFIASDDPRALAAMHAGLTANWTVVSFDGESRSSRTRRSFLDLYAISQGHALLANPHSSFSMFASYLQRCRGVPYRNHIWFRTSRPRSASP